MYYGNKRKKKYYKYDKTKWFDIIKLAGFKKESYDKIHEYIDNHIRYELNYPILFNEEIGESSLPLALKVLAKLDKKDLLNKIIFVGQVMGCAFYGGTKYDYYVNTYGYQFKFNKNKMILNDITYVNNEFIEKTIQQFEVMLNQNNEPVFIFILFARTIMPEPNHFKVFHRYCQHNVESIT